MWASGDFVTPRVNGFVYLDKPPLLHWLTALSIGCFGPRAFAVRLSSLLAAAAGVTLVYAFGRRTGGHQAGLVSAAVLASSVLWFAVGRVIRYDMLLTLSVTGTLWWAWLGSERGREGRGYYCLAALAAGLGVLVKGPVALVLPGAVLLPYLMITRRLRTLLEVRWLAVLGILVVVIVPWFALCEHANPGAVRFFLLHENLARVRGQIDEAHHQPWWYLVPVLLGACLPWTLLLPGAAVEAAGQARRGDDPERRACILWLLWLVVPLLVFSLSKVKVVTYILPSLPAAALLIGRYVWPERARGRWALAAAGGLLCVVGCLLLLSSLFLKLSQPVPPYWWAAGVPAIAVGLLVAILAGANARKWALGCLAGGALAVCYAWLLSLGTGLVSSDRDIAREVGALRRPGERIYCVRKLSRGAVFYLDERVAVFGSAPAEYDFPGNQDALEAWVYPLDEARAVLSRGPGAIIICRSRFREEFQAAAGDAVTEIATTRKAVIFRSGSVSAHHIPAGRGSP